MTLRPRQWGHEKRSYFVCIYKVDSSRFADGWLLDLKERRIQNSSRVWGQDGAALNWVEKQFGQRCEFDPWIDNPLQHSCLENPTDRGPGGLKCTESQRVGHNWSHLARTHLKLMTFFNSKGCCEIMYHYESDGISSSRTEHLALAHDITWGTEANGTLEMLPNKLWGLWLSGQVA